MPTDGQDRVAARCPESSQEGARCIFDEGHDGNHFAKDSFSYYSWETPRPHEAAARRLRSASFPTRLLMLALSMFVLYIPTVWLHWPYVLGWFVGAIIVGLAEWARRG